MESQTFIVCQKTMTSEKTAPYLRLHQNDKLRIPTYQAEMEPAIFFIRSHVKCHEIHTKCKKLQTRLTSCTARFENVGNFSLKQNTTDHRSYMTQII